MTESHDDAIIHRTDALALGITDREMAARVRSGELFQLGPGVFARAEQRKPEHTHRLRIRASRDLSLPVSHQSAGAMHHLGLLKPDLSRIHVTTGSPSGGRMHPTRHYHSGVVDDADVVVVDGVPVTSLERTASDIACSGDFDRALVVLDSAMRAGADRDLIADMLARPRRGVSVARVALPHADGASESVGESWCRAQMITAGHPIPRLQDERRIRGRRIITDFDWDRKLVCEFDGLVKYGRLVPDGQTTADVVIDEKEREDLLRWTGSMVVRVLWRDLERRTATGMIEPWLRRLDLM